MSRRFWCVAAVGLMFGALGIHAADTLPEKWSKRVESADGTYQSAARRAEGLYLLAVQKANTDRLKLFRQVLADVTKAGDFDAATAIKSQITQAETDHVIDPDDVPRNRPFFLTALYGCNQSWTDITDQMNRMSRETKVIRLIVSDAVFKDPAPNYDGKNSFVGRYLLNGKIHIQSVYTDVELVIPPQ